MPLAGPIPEGRTFFCPHCGALYSVTHSRLPESDSKISLNDLKMPNLSPNAHSPELKTT